MRCTEVFGIERPVVPGGMQWLSRGIEALHKCISVRHAVKAESIEVDGINMGSRFMCTVESAIHRNVEDAVAAGSGIAWGLIDDVGAVGELASRIVTDAEQIIDERLCGALR